MEEKREISYEEAMELRKDSVSKMREEIKLLKIEAEYYKLIEQIEVSSLNRMMVQMKKAEMMYDPKQDEKGDSVAKSRMEVSRED